jgi:polysaccharide export outer membrane protein
VDLQNSSHRRSNRSPKRAIRFARQVIDLALGVSLLLSPMACSTRVAPPPLAPPVTGYVVGAPDLLLIHILPEPEINREARVRPDGMISIDLIGDVQAAGRTPFEIAQTIQHEIGRYKRDATVNVMVIDSPSQFVTVFGEVGRPGTFPLSSQTRMFEAIGRVGGTRPFASLNSIRVIRTNGVETKVLSVRLADIKDGDLTTNIVVNAGDLIVVPPTLLARIGYVMQMIFFPFQPPVAVLGSIGGAANGVNAF